MKIIRAIAVLALVVGCADTSPPPREGAPAADTIIVYADTVWVLGADTIYIDGGAIEIDPRAHLTIVYAKWFGEDIPAGIFHGYFYWTDSAGCDSTYFEPFCFGCLTCYPLRIIPGPDSSSISIDWSGGVLAMYPMTGAFYPDSFPAIRIRKTGGRP